MKLPTGQIHYSLPGFVFIGTLLLSAYALSTRTRDFHPLDCVHAGRTIKNTFQTIFERHLYNLYSLLDSLKNSENKIAERKGFEPLNAITRYTISNFAKHLLPILW